MNAPLTLATALLVALGTLQAAPRKFSIRQSWEQEPAGFDRPFFVHVPEVKEGKVPVLLFFHGAGGSAERAIGGWIRKFPDHLILAAQGYRGTWNVHGERSRAPDVRFLREILGRIAKDFPQADRQRVTFAGFSNGAGFIHRLLIEIDEPLFQKAVVQAASMVEQQFHDGAFWMPTRSTDHYDRKKAPALRPEILYVHGDRDKVVPFAGGVRGRKFPHLSAPETAFRWARAQGYEGRMPADDEGEKVGKGLIRHRYPGSRVTFIRVVQGNHGLQPHRAEADALVRAFNRRTSGDDS